MVQTFFFVVLFEVELFFRVVLPSGLQEVRHVQRFFTVVLTQSLRQRLFNVFGNVCFQVFHFPEALKNISKKNRSDFFVTKYI